MSAYIKTLKDINGDQVIPRTKVEAITDANDVALATTLAGKEDSSNKVTSLSSASTDAQYPSAKIVYDTISALPKPMIFKGTLGAGGTITSLPEASSSNEGFTYKVITAGTYASQEAKVGDVFISNGSAWVLIPAGDVDTDTWRQLNVDGAQWLGNSISSGAANFKAGDNITLTPNGNDLTIAASIDTSSKEDKSNKVSSWSTTTTNDHYPSEKLVKDSLDNKSNVSVSASGTATDEIQYITVDGVEKKIASGANLTAGKNVTISNNEINALKYFKKAEVTGVAGTSSTQLSSTYDVTDSTITEYYDGMVVSFVLPVVGVTTYGSVFQINSLGYKPIVYGTNSIVGTRYPVGGQITMIYNSEQTAAAYLTKATKTTITGCWQICDYDQNTTDAYALIDYNFRPYAGSDIYRYKLCLQDKDNRLQPIVTTNQESTTQVVKTVNTTPLRPEQIWFYNDATTIKAGATTAKYKLMASDYGAFCAYNFNAAIPSYRMIYLAGSYDKTTGLFTLDNSTTTSYYATVPNKSANITLSSYLTTGKYYILLGSSYSSNDELQLFVNNPMYYFDGTNLIPYTEAELKSKINEPASEGTNGQVLTTDGNGGRTWTTVGGSSEQIFWCTYGTSTFAEIKAAYDAGKLPICIDDDKRLPLSVYTDSVIYFGNSYTGLNSKYANVTSANSWAHGSKGLETTSNKVTTWSATTTDANYPSEKLVKDSLDAKSAVSVSNTGTSTDEVQYITIDGVEKKLAGGSGGASVWGSITGNIEDQADLQSALATKSAVSVSASGTATDVIQYITVDGIEKKLPSGGSGGTAHIL